MDNQSTRGRYSLTIRSGPNRRVSNVVTRNLGNYEQQAFTNWAEEMEAEDEISRLREDLNIEEDAVDEADQEEQQAVNELVDESDEEIDIPDILLDNETVECCTSMHNFNITNLAGFGSCRSQFKGKFPDLDCLHNLSSVGDKILQYLNTLTNLPANVGYVVKQIAKHRHDFFAYFLMNYALNINSPYGTDMEFKSIVSNRTPDYVKEDLEEKKVIIIEFSVVGNMLRGNFLKGVDEYTSKYKNEINQYRAKGFEVVYKPLLLSTSSTLQENLDYLKVRNVVVTDELSTHIDQIRLSIRQELQYLITYSFDDTCNVRQSHGYSQEIDSNNGWYYLSVNGNKSKFLSAYQVLLSTTFQNLPYRFVLTKYPRILQVDSGPDLLNGREFKKLQGDQIGFFMKYRDSFKGKQSFFIQGYRKPTSTNIDILKHGSAYEYTQEDLCSTFKTAVKYQDSVPLKTVQNMVQNLWSMPNGSLVTKNSRDSVVIALENYRKGLNKWQNVQNNILPPILNDPRRSFSNLLDSRNIYDVSYKQGIVIKYPNYLAVSMSAKLLLSKKDKPIFENDDIEVDPDLADGYKKATSDIFAYIKSLSLDTNQSFKRLKTQMTLEQQTQFNKLNDSLKVSQTKYTKIRKSNRTGIIRLTPDDREMIKKDMSWKAKTGYKLYMGQLQDLTNLSNLVFSSTNGINFNFNVPQSVDIEIFKKIKKLAQDKLNVYISEVKSTKIFDLLVFHSRLCYTLFAASNQNFSNNYIKYDNLGLTDVCLMIKGGKKITSTRSSKIFKLIYPALKEVEDWNKKQCFYFKDQAYEETPWMTLHQNEILDGMALPYKYLLNYISTRLKYSKTVTQDVLFIPTMLSLHNRRKTEQKMHNLRYLIVNCMGKFSQVGDMLKEFMAPTYSPFDHALYYGLAENYIKYYDSVNEWVKLGSNDAITFKNCKVNHPIFPRYIHNIDDLSCIIYSTYMMTKGGYQQSLEQTVNLQSIMETHETWLKTDKQKVVLPPDVNNELLYDNDFSFSPDLSYAVGKMLSAEMIKAHAVNHLHINYKRILSEPVDSFANNRGLRHQGKDFFGHKGYFVVYKQLLDDNLPKILDIINDNTKDHPTKYKELKMFNKTFSTQQQTTKLDKVVFHVVDKMQRAGSREIYVMDYNTKLYQNPIEKMFKLICKFTENEIISIPSSRRTQLIHKKNFEYKNDKYQTYFLTYDCRKWAPRSNTDKYLHMLDGMREVLPDDFIEDVKFYFSKHQQKEIKTRIPIYEQLNKKTQNRYQHLFTINEEEQSASFVMPYSFVMGIFNMLSSLFHSGAQLLISKYVSEFAHSENYFAELNMLAHSDDSGGSLSLIATDPDIKAAKCLSFYQHAQKALNHLMSTKKCNTSQNYFELLSTLYMNDELLPLLPKFLSNFTSNFTGLGISADFKQIISKSIELQTNGSTGEEAYMCQLIMSNFYRSFYRLDHDTTLPALGGTADSWPTLYLAFGSIIDEIRVSMINPDLYMRFMSFAMKHLDFELTDGTVNLKMQRMIRIPAAYKNWKSSVKLPEFMDNQWFFSQNKTRHSMLNLLWFRAQLDSPNFAISLLNINEIRRAYDSLYAASGSHILGKTTTFTINEIYLQIMKFEPKITQYYQFFKQIHATAINFYDDMSVIDQVDVTQRAVFSYKPCQLNMTSYQDMPITMYNSMDLAVQICRPELSPYLYKQTSYGPEIETMKQYLINLDIPLELKYVKSFLDFVTKFQTFTTHFYMRSTSTRRVYNGIVGILDVIANSYSSQGNLEIDHRVLRHQAKTDLEFNEEVTDRVLAAYLYKFCKDTRQDELSYIPVKIGDKHYSLRSVPETPWIGVGSSELNFINLIGEFEGKKISLSHYGCWAFWSDRQVKIAGKWVGEGILTVKLSGFILQMHVKHQQITEIKTSFIEPKLFSDIESKFFHSLLLENELDYIHTPKMGVAQYYLGLNKMNQFGIHNEVEIALGVKITYDHWLENEVFEQPLFYKYESGSHIIKLKGLNHKLHTLDSVIFSQSKAKLFNLIDWQNLKSELQASILTMAFSGNYGVDLGVNYDIDEIKKNFRNTELYGLLYNEVFKKKNRLAGAFWNDITTYATASEDILPIMFETSQLNSLQKLIPESRKNIIDLYRFYDIDNKLIFDFRKNLMNFDNEASQNEYLTSVLTELGDRYNLANIPEIGDEQEFNHYMYENDLIPMQYKIMAVEIVSEAMVAGFEQLPLLIRSKLIDIAGVSINEFLIQEAIFGDLIAYKGQTKQYKVLTHDLMLVHELLERIFEHKPSFVEFARKFRNTSMRKVPRHPIYEENWHILIAELHKYFQIIEVTQEEIEYYPTVYRRKKMLQKIPIDYEILPTENYSGSLLFNMVYETENIEMGFYEKTLMNLLNFNADPSEIKNDYESYEEACDEEDIEFEGSRRQVYKKAVLYPYTKPTNVAVDKAIICKWFLPIKQIHWKRINNKHYYAYNLNEDVAKTMGFKKKKFNFEMRSQKYLKYQDQALKTFVINQDKREVKFDFELEMRRDNYLKISNLENPETYNDKFVQLFCEHFEIKKEKTIEMVKAIAESKRAPVVKGIMLRKLLRDMTSSKGSKLDHLIQKALHSFQKTVNVDFSETIKLDFAIGSKFKGKLIEKTTSLKSEYAQLKILLGNCVDNLIVGDLTLKPGIKKSLQQNIKLLINKWKGKDLEKVALLRLMFEVVECTTEGTQNNDGDELDEAIRNYLNEMSPDDIDEEEEDIFDEPTYKIKQWRIVR